MDRSSWNFTSLPCIAIALALALLCAGVTWITYNMVGGRTIAGLPQTGSRAAAPGEQTMSQALSTRTPAVYRLREPCQFANTQGTLVDTTLVLTGGAGPSQEMPREQVIETVQLSMFRDYYEVRDGQVTLTPGIPVNAILLDDGSVSLRLDQDLSVQAGGGVAQRTVSAVVAGETITGNFYFNQDLSLVEAGQQVTRTLNISADFVCLLEWLPPPELQTP